LSPDSKEVRHFRLGLRDAGYSEGRDVVIDWRLANGDYARVPELVADLVRSKIDVMVMDSTIGTEVAKRATSTIPIVMALVIDPVGSGLVDSLAHPGGNVTGLSRAFSDVTRAYAQALYLMDDPILFAHQAILLKLASAARLPIIGDLRRFPEAGALVSYGPDSYDLFRRSATYVDRILRGSKPADLPVEQPTRFELVINLGTAKALGLTIPDKLLALADDVIE
jgi:ABC-type uncharacterized transport system substrate-binding protein